MPKHIAEVSKTRFFTVTQGCGQLEPSHSFHEDAAGGKRLGVRG